MNSPDAPQNHKTLRVWDILVRLFHWSLVAGMAAAWISSSSRSEAHQWIGLGVAGLVVLRLIWGFVGTRYARFSNFISGPRAVLRYLGSIVRGNEQRHVGHNPAGGAMIVALIVAILLTGLTGWLMTTDAYYGDEVMQFTHSAFAYGVVALIALHLAGVVLASVRHKENLVRAMITGEKRAPHEGDVA
jgi:cytochrome b